VTFQLFILQFFDEKKKTINYERKWCAKSICREGKWDYNDSITREVKTCASKAAEAERSTVFWSVFLCRTIFYYSWLFTIQKY
jgi:hypothetical protein